MASYYKQKNMASKCFMSNNFAITLFQQSKQSAKLKKLIINLITMLKNTSNARQSPLDIHESLVNHYKKARTLKMNKTIHKQSIVRQAYQKKQEIQEETSPYQDFIRNQRHIAADSEPLDFRSLPRKLKVYFPKPPSPPPKLPQIAYTYQSVPNVPYTMPKQKPGYVGDWVLQQSYFVDSCVKNKSFSDKIQRQKFQHIDRRQTRQKFRHAMRKVANVMKVKNLSLKEVIKNKSFTKKSHGYYNSIQYFQAIKNNEQQNVQQMMEMNPYLAFDIDDQEMTGLHWAARQGHTYLVKVLLQKFRANPEAKDVYGRTALHHAVMKRHPQCMMRIFIEGGKLATMTNDKKTVRMVATDSYTKYLLQKLEQAKYAARAKSTNYKEYKQILQKTIRQNLDQTSLYF